ncbi:MAG: hypothetical protein LBP33_07125, partial [Candidatus Adiutrix sp.]|nr:hypothetical protein [Candidatus Adiutrix sp.]
MALTGDKITEYLSKYPAYGNNGKIIEAVYNFCTSLSTYGFNEAQWNSFFENYLLQTIAKSSTLIGNLAEFTKNIGTNNPQPQIIFETKSQTSSDGNTIFIDWHLLLRDPADHE